MALEDADNKALGQLYLVPRLGDRLLSEIDTDTILDMKAQLQASPGAKAAGKEGTGKPLSALSAVGRKDSDSRRKRLALRSACQTNRRGEEAATKTEASVRPIPIPGLPRPRAQALEARVSDHGSRPGLPWGAERTG